MRVNTIAAVVGCLFMFATMVNSLNCWFGVTANPSSTANHLNFTACNSNQDKCYAATGKCDSSSPGGASEARAFTCASQSEIDSAKSQATSVQGCSITSELICNSDLCNSGLQATASFAVLAIAAAVLAF